MTLDQWLKAERGRAAFMAAHFGVSISAVLQWVDGVPPSRMAEVRVITAGAVSLEEMLPKPKPAPGASATPVAQEA